MSQERYVCEQCGHAGKWREVPDAACVPPIVVLDAHNDELEIRRVYMADGPDGRRQLMIATNGEPEE